jgi:hypothetical protein
MFYSPENRNAKGSSLFCHGIDALKKLLIAPRGNLIKLFGVNLITLFVSLIFELHQGPMLFVKIVSYLPIFAISLSVSPWQAFYQTLGWAGKACQ